MGLIYSWEVGRRKFELRLLEEGKRKISKENKKDNKYINI